MFENKVDNMNKPSAGNFSRANASTPLRQDFHLFHPSLSSVNLFRSSCAVSDIVRERRAFLHAGHKVASSPDHLHMSKPRGSKTSIRCQSVMQCQQKPLLLKRIHTLVTL